MDLKNLIDLNKNLIFQNYPVMNKDLKLGIKIHFWTINNPTTIQKLLELNVDGIMTNDCVLLKTIMEEQYKWPAA